MGIPWRSARAWLWKALDPHEATGEATAPELDNADAGEEVAKKDGASSPWKSSGKQIGAAKVMILGFLVILVSGARFIMSKRSRPNVTAPHLPVDDASMEHYLDDFNKAADAMKDAWESSGQPVRRAFQLHFTPSLEEGQELPHDPLAAISEHVAKMRDCEVPSASPVEARNDFAQHLQLLHSICRIVRLRLDELKWFVLVNERIKVPVPVPGYDTPYSYPALEVLEGKVEGGLTATSFLKSVGLFGGEPTQQVDERITDKLMPLLSVENKQTIYDSVARYYFERFLESCGEVDDLYAAFPRAKYQIPYSNTQLRTGALARAAAQIFRESDGSTNYTHVRKMHRLADNWTNKGILEASKRQEERNANHFEKRLKIKREQMRALLRQGIPKDDLVMIFLFLL